MQPILFTIGPVAIYSFSVFLLLAWLLFSFIYWKQLREQAVEEERIFDLTFYSTLVGVLSARLAFVATHRELFSDTPLKVVAIWIQPGLSLYGAIIGGFLAMLFISRKYKIRVAYVLDALAFSLPWALIIGSIGSFLDGTVVGKLTHGWGVLYLGFPGKRHPVQLYEGIFLFLLLLLLFVVQSKAIKRGWPYGVSGLWFFTLFAIGMFSIEFFKESSVYFSYLSANQWVLVGFFAEALGAFYVRGGGKEFVLHQVNSSRQRFGKLLGNLYAKFPKRHTS